MSHEGRSIIVELPTSSTVIVKSVPLTAIVAVGVVILIFCFEFFAICPDAYLIVPKDAFRVKNGYGVHSGSWFTNKGVGRRYDHVFSSKDIAIKDAFYEHAPRNNKLSDHSPLVVELSIR